ncbi:head GIN domain-containing protein [Tamlana sp. 2201CG12-4]|uniref:head GIN domain-containing protein n=1 Tax=Tamlana sp. 2201CG12-4 TaxID=3112582 RepID=UPI002DBCC491|nr:head GIN domain-containing protein [Tamlana sp. 2201CG12-4]MEC3906246.1 head GIN domain-containing protein [Tamlana sp. 2201CG12-4]
MKRIITILTILMSAVVFAQDTTEKTIGEFSELKVYDLIQVELVKSDIDKVVITGDHRNNVLVNNKSGKLKIKMNFEKSFNGAKTKVVLYYTKIDVIDVNEGAQVKSDDLIKQFEVDLRAQEGGSIDVPVDVTYTNIKAVTGGIVETSGISKNQKVSLLTGGIYKGEALKTEVTEVTINAAGEAYIHASKLADVKVRAGGDVYIYGNPETINESKVFGGRIKRMDI